MTTTPKNLKNLTPIDEALRLVPLLGGPDKVLEAARAAMNANEFAWTAKPANQLSLLNNLPNQARFAR